MTEEEGKLLDAANTWRYKDPFMAVNDAINALAKYPRNGSVHEPEIQSALDSLEKIKADLKDAKWQIVDRKLRELRILGMK